MRRLARYASSATEVARSAGHPWPTRSLTSPGKSKPRDMEMTCAWLSSAHWRPRKIISESPAPSSPSTLPISARVTPGATPIRVPSTSRPKTVPAQCVPCPFLSPFPDPEKSAWVSSTPVNAGCDASMPVSRTATTTPAPVRDDLSAPTADTPHAVLVACGVVWSSGSSTGWTSIVGMTGAMARTAGSRPSDRTSDLSSRSTSTRSPTEPRSDASRDSPPP